MSIFDSLIRDVGSRFGIGPQAAALVRESLRLITGTPGGVGGFLDKFRNAGLGGLVSSWLGKSENVPIATGQLENVLGVGSIDALGRKVGLSPAAVAPALAFLVPKLVDLLTPDGTVPEGVPPTASAFLAGSAGAAVAPSDRGEAKRGGISPWLWALLGALLLGGLAWWFVGRPAVQVATPVPAPAPLVQPAPSVPAKLSLSSTGEKVQFNGVAGNEQARSSILAALQRVFGSGNVTGDIVVDPQIGPAAWLAKLEPALQKLKVPGLDAMFESTTISLGGTLPQADLDALKATIADLFGPGFTVGSLSDRAAAWYSDAKSRTLAALTALQPGFSGADLVNALNLAIINFETGSARISSDSRDLLEKSAAAIKAAPAGTRIEVGGHTDNTGDPQANLQLSQQRAETVRITLVEMGVDPAMLVAQGYGDTKPVASNATSDGRFQNRRIEFVILN